MKEKCVLCNKEVEYDISLDINYRACYIEGAGQLCDKCFKEIYSYD